MTLIETAINLATTAHEGQLDKSGNPYIQHPIRMMDRALALGLGEAVAMAAVLHDVIEDCPGYTAATLIEAGIPPEVVTAVEALSKAEGEKWWDYIERVKANPIARQVKPLDIEDNSRPIRMGGIDPNYRHFLLTKRYPRTLERLAAEG
jgi:(p)ppGpp synthase/HD superfamily hydrolase